MSIVKATPFVSGLGSDIAAPFFDNDSTLHVLLQNTGEILSVKESNGQTQTVNSTSGQPGGAIFDNEGVLYVSDIAHGSVLAFQNDGSMDSVVAVYEDKPFKGPSSIAYSQGSFFFTDSGPLGETGLSSPQGSLFCITNSPSGQILKPISLNNLAQPVGVAVTYDGNFVYVAEMMKNRIIRYFQKPEGVYHGSVFYQFQGGVGPSCVCVDRNGTLYVGQYDVKESSSEGYVYVISKTGKLLSTIQTQGAEISGVAVRNGKLYITEKSTGSIYIVQI